MKRYFLIGLPGCGKTTLGRLLASRLNLDFIDLDEWVSQKEKTCRELYQEIGSQGFRKLENRALDRIPHKTAIIALGGGTLCTPENFKKVTQMGTVIYLEENQKIVFKRLLKDPLPGYLDKKDPEGSFSALAEERIPIYEQAATFTVNLKERLPETLLEDILHGIE